MAIFKVTFFFRSGVVGWSENYYTEQGTHAQVAIHARNLAIARMRLCGVGIDLPFLRISDLQIRGDSFDDGEPGYTTSPAHAGFNLVKSVADPERADVGNVATIFTISSQNVAVGRIFARGLPDDFNINDRVFNPDSNWDKAFIGFQKTFSNAQSGWCVLRKSKSTPGNTGSLFAALAVLGSNLSIVHTANVTFVPGTIVALRGMRTHTGQRFSGNFSVVTSNAGTTTVYKTFSDPQPLFTLNKGTIQSATPGTLNGLNISYGRLTTTRKSGRPFGVPLGRRKRVPTLQ